MTAPWLRAPGVVRALSAALLVVLAPQGTVVLHQCVSSDGLAAPLGVRLALLGGTTDCPEGTLGLTPAGQGGAVLMLGLALPAIVAYAVLLLGGVGLTAVTARAVASVRVLLGGVLPHVLRAPDVVTVGPSLVVPAHDPPTRRFVGLPAAHPRRGPPALTA